MANQPTQRWSQLRPHPDQIAFAATILPQSPYRFIALPCGRRSGKTELCKRRLVTACSIDRGHGQLQEFRAAAPTRDHVLDLYWQDLKDLMPPGWVTDIKEAKLEIWTNVGGLRSRIKLVSLEKAERAEGMGYDGIIIDESSDIKPGIYNLKLRPALADRKGWCVRTGIPKRVGVGAREYREFCIKCFSGKYPNHTAFTWPSEDVLDAEEIAALLEDLTPEDYREQCGAVWIDAGQGAFYCYDANTHIRTCDYDPTRKILVGCDFNVSPMGWVLCHRDGDSLEVFDEVFLSNTWTQQTLDKLWDKYGEKHKGGWDFYGDATSRNRNVNASLSSYTQIHNDKRFKVVPKFPSSNPNPKDRLTSCNLLLRNAAGKVRCWIDPKCKHLIADLEKRMLDDDGNPEEGKPGDPIGHVSDGWGYLVHSVFPSTLIVPTGKASVIIHRD